MTNHLVLTTVTWSNA